MSRMKAEVVCKFLIFALSLFHAPALFGQGQTTGAVQGHIYEIGSNASIAGAVVTLRNQETGLERTTVTNAEGNYFISTLPPGFYTLSAVRDGYQQDSLTGFPIRLSKTNVVQPPPIGLRKVETTPTPTTPTPTPTPPPQPQASPRPVESEAEQLVNTTNATISGNFSRWQLLSLPLSGIRSFDQLAFLVPGVAPPPQAIGGTVGPGIGPGVGTSGQFSVNGLRSRANNFTIDGADNNDEEIGVRRQGFTTLVPQPIESIQEFQIATLLAPPEFGRNMAAQVNAVTRAGGLNLHGMVYGFLTDKRLKARDPFDFEGGPSNFPLTRASDGRPIMLVSGGARTPLAPANPVGGENPFTRAQYGGVIGGPIGDSGTQFFFAFERQDINASRESHFAVPTPAERGLFGSGDQGLTDSLGNPVLPASLTGNSFFSLFPFPNNPMGPYGLNTFTDVLPAGADGTVLSGKLDHDFKWFGGEHSLSGRYNFTDDDTDLPVTGEALFSSLRALVRTQNLAVLFNSAMTTNTSNQVRFSYGRTSLDFEEIRNPFLIRSGLFPDVPFLLNAPFLVNISLPGQDPAFLSLQGVDSESLGSSLVGPGTGPLGELRVSGFSKIGVNVFFFPQSRTNNTFQIADTMVHNRGSHTLTFGFDTRRVHLNSVMDRNFRPIAEFSAAADLSLNQLSQSAALPGFYLGSDFVSVGAPTTFLQSLAITPDSKIRMRFWQHNFFVSDRIRLRPNFTVTLGLRYELNTVPTEADDRIESTFGSPEVAEFIGFEKAVFGASGLESFLAGRTKIYEGDNNNFAPHVAFAWDPWNDGRTSIRGGYGIYYDQIIGAVVSQSRNVFPSFIPINMAGFLFRETDAQGNPLPVRLGQQSFTPAIFAVPGTLNTFDRSIGNPTAFAIDLAINTLFSSGAAFVLPAADLTTPYAQHWSLSVERQLASDFIASVAYVGTSGKHLLRFATPNLGPNSLPIVDQILSVEEVPGLFFPAFFGDMISPFSASTGFLRPFPLLGSFTSIESDANSLYHSLQVRFDKRFSQGVQFTTSYTWSHAIDEVSDLFDLASGPALPQNSFDREAERASASFDVRHRFVYSVVWDMPFLRNTPVLGGWQLASIGTFQTGQPYSVLLCCDFNLDGNLTDRISDPNGLDISTSGRNNFRAPGVATIDAALNKEFRITERQAVQFRTEVFNLFNRSHFGTPVNQIAFGGFGARPLTEKIFVDTRIPARTIQFALKYRF